MENFISFHLVLGFEPYHLHHASVLLLFILFLKQGLTNFAWNCLLSSTGIMCLFVCLFI
jgi:hypothetical protein